MFGLVFGSMHVSSDYTHCLDGVQSASYILSYMMDSLPKCRGEESPEHTPKDIG